MNTKNDTFVSTRSSPTQMEPGPTALSPIATSETLVPGGWETHTSQQCEYEISYPAEIQIHPQTPYSDLLVFDLSNSDAGPRNFVYVSVITPDIISIVKQGVYDHEVYNYDPAATEALLQMQVGESQAVHASADLASGFTYQRLPDTKIGGHTAQTYENLQPWEFPSRTKEIRYYIPLGGCMYLIGGYMDTTGPNPPGAITESLFHKIISTVQWMP